MPERDALATIIDRIVAGAHIVSRAERDDLRRELWTHFEEAANAGGDIGTALDRFGARAQITELFRQVYRNDYFVLYLIKIVVSIVASSAAALCIQAAVNLRVELQAEAVRLAPNFWRTAIVSVGIVIGFVTAWEVGRSRVSRPRALAAIAIYIGTCGVVQAGYTYAPHMGPFIMVTMLVGIGAICSRLERWLTRVLFAFAAFAATVYLAHFSLTGFGVGRAAFAGGVYMAVWASTLVIVGRLNNAFGNLFQTTAES